jgi:hypothetical protein
MPTIYVDLFCRKQRSPVRWPEWYRPGTPQDALRSWSGALFLALARVLTALGAIGLAIAVARRDARLVVPVAVALATGAAHVLTWMDVTYYYLKLPFLAIFGLYGLERAVPRTLRLGEWRVPLAGVTLGALLALGAAATAAMLIWSL